MTKPLTKNFSNPDEVRKIRDGRVEVIDLDGFGCVKVRYEPGYRWSESLSESAGTDTCQFTHQGYVLGGRLRVRMEDGSEAEVGPGDVFVVPPGHDGWVVGDEPFEALDFSDQMRGYAR
ncbi:MAG: cupin domain-containing protein [Actinomycetota bacterium]